jgi:hypothetical protein
MSKIVGCLVNTQTKEWFQYDEDYRIWSFPNLTDGPTVSICLTRTDELKAEGELRELQRKIAAARKELGLLHSETTEEGLKRLKQKS